MLPRGVSVPRDDSATVPHPMRMGVTWCAVEEGTTHTSTPRCGNVIANSTGAALWSATRVVSGQRCSPANNGIMCKQTEPIAISEESGVQPTTTASFCTSNLLREKNPNHHHNDHSLPTTYTSKDGAFFLAGCCNWKTRNLETRATGLRWCWQPHETLFFKLQSGCCRFSCVLSYTYQRSWSHCSSQEI